MSIGYFYKYGGLSTIDEELLSINLFSINLPNVLSQIAFWLAKLFAIYSIVEGEWCNIGPLSTNWGPLLSIFEVSVKRI